MVLALVGQPSVQSRVSSSSSHFVRYLQLFSFISSSHRRNRTLAMGRPIIWSINNAVFDTGHQDQNPPRHVGSQLAAVLALLDERASMSARPFWRSCMANPTKRLTLDGLSTAISELPFNWALFPANPCTLGSLWIRATTCHRSIHLVLLTHRPTSLSVFWEYCFHHLGFLSLFPRNSELLCGPRTPSH